MRETDLYRLQDLHNMPWASRETIAKLIECKQGMAIQEAKKKLNLNDNGNK